MSNIIEKAKNVDFLIVGAGFYGSVLAERLANDAGKKVLVIDRRDHIGGNSFSYKDEETNIEVHKYGSHLFHTSDEDVWQYLNQFCEFNDYQHKVFTQYEGETYTMPINLSTINQFYKKNFSPSEAKDFIEKEIERSKIENPGNLKEKGVSLIGEPLFNAFIAGYTAKQWDTPLKELPANIITRLPVRYNYNNRYFNDKYEGLPKEGYGALFEKILDHSLIEVVLETDFFEYKDQLPEDLQIIYSGPIDRFFDYKYGQLNWRTIDFEIETHEVDDFQGTAVMNYAEKEVPFTRIHEFKHYHPERKQSQSKTITFKEFSRMATKEDAPYYPVNTTEDKETYLKYFEETKKTKNIIFGGRLGSYKYLDMHQVIKSSLSTYNKLKDNL